MLQESSVEKIEELCKRHSVDRLEAFGSAVRGRFTPGRSDMDFLVRFLPCTPEEHANRYFALLADLEDLFSCNVDLVEIGAVRNPYFLEAIEQSRKLLYAA